MDSGFYAPYPYAYRLDFSTEGEETITQAVELLGWHGMVSAITYKDNGPDGFNLYLGMAIDP